MGASRRTEHTRHHRERLTITLAQAGVAAGGGALGGLLVGGIMWRAARRQWQEDIAAARSVHQLRPPLLVKKPEAAERLGVGLRTIERLLATGELRAVKVGRSTRLVATELEAFVATLQSRREGPSEV